MQRLTFSLLFTFLCTISVYSQGKPITAVFPFNAVGVAEIESITASDLFETALVQTSSFMIIEQDQITKILETQFLTLNGCTDESCAVEIGKLLSAEQIVLGSFSRLGSSYIINAKIIDVALGRNIQAYKVSFTSIDELSESVEFLAYRLAGLTSNPTVKIRELKEELSVLKLEYEKVKARAVKRNISKYVFGGLALVSLGGSGISWMMGNDAYTNYKNTVYTDKAAEYREESEMYDILKLSAGGVGIGFSILSLINWVKGDKRPELKQKMVAISAQIAELEARQ